MTCMLSSRHCFIIKKMYWADTVSETWQAGPEGLLLHHV